jgi:hypothetical protein
MFCVFFIFDVFMIKNIAKKVRNSLFETLCGLFGAVRKWTENTWVGISVTIRGDPRIYQTPHSADNFLLCYWSMLRSADNLWSLWDSADNRGDSRRTPQVKITLALTKKFCEEITCLRTWDLSHNFLPIQTRMLSSHAWKWIKKDSKLQKDGKNQRLKKKN